MNKTSFIFLLLVARFSCAQPDTLTINGYQFSIVSTVENNEWGTVDTVKQLFRLEGKEWVNVLCFYPFKDQGGDCNNLFWSKETLTIEGNLLIFQTRYYQKTGIDPIYDRRKQVYRVSENGSVILIFDKYKFPWSTEWENL